MTFDEDRHREELARWAAEDMVWFGVKGWERHGGGSGGGLGFLQGGETRMVRMSVSAAFVDPDGRRIAITSHRRDDDGYSRLREWTPINTFHAAQRAAGGRVDGGGRRRSPSRRLEPPEVSWEQVVIAVDGEVTPFELCRFDGGFWAAIGRGTGADITIDSHGAPIEGIELEQIAEPPPEMPTPSPPPPPASARFPEELFTADMPDSVPASSAVELVYRNRSRLTGSVGDAKVDIVLEVPSSASTAVGAARGQQMQAAWSLSDNSGGDPVLPASIEGSVGGDPMSIRGVFRLAPGFWFDGATIEGDLAGVRLTATVARAEGAYGSSSTVVARGTVGVSGFELFAAVDGSLDRAVLRGSIGGERVHIDARASRGRNAARLSGVFPAPLPLVLLTTAAILFFV